MKIDDLYVNKENSGEPKSTIKEAYFLGFIAKVQRDSADIQIENQSLLNYRRNKLEKIIPNTINNFVLVDGVEGIFIGQTFQLEVSGGSNVRQALLKKEDEHIYPTAKIEVLGLLEGENLKKSSFVKPGFRGVGISDKVYLANRSVVEKFIKSIEINKGKDDELLEIATMSQDENLKISVSPDTLFDRHLLAIGTTNSGKSTSALKILDEMLKKKKKIFVVDPTGEYAESFIKDEKCIRLTIGENTYIAKEKVELDQMTLLFNANDNSQRTTLYNAIRSLQYAKKKSEEIAKENTQDKSVESEEAKFGIKDGLLIKHGKKVDVIQDELKTVQGNEDFDIELLVDQIKEESVKIYVNIGDTESPDEFKIDNRMLYNNQYLIDKVDEVISNTKLVELFKKNVSIGSDKVIDIANAILSFLRKPDMSLYIDCSSPSVKDEIGEFVVDYISNFLMDNVQKGCDPFIYFIDEAHRYTVGSERNKQSGLVSIAREGRKKGIFLFLTTQRPSDLPTTVLGQIGSVIVHRLTHSNDISTIENWIQPNFIPYLKNLGQGSAIISSINLTQDIFVNFKQSNRNHGNETKSFSKSK